MRRLSRDRRSCTVAEKGGCAPSEGVSGICEVPVSPWQAKQVGRRASRDCAQSEDAAKPARMAPIARLRMSLSRNVGEWGEGASVEGGGPPSTGRRSKRPADDRWAAEL